MTGQGITVVPEVANRETGELVRLDAAVATTDVAEVRLAASRAKAAIDADLREVDEFLTSRLDHEARRSATVGSYRIEGSAPDEWETDAKPLRAELLAFVEAGVLSTDAVDRAVEVVEDLEVSRAGVNALRNHPDEQVRQVVEKYDRKVPAKRRRVTVKELTP